MSNPIITVNPVHNELVDEVAKYIKDKYNPDGAIIRSITYASATIMIELGECLELQAIVVPSKVEFFLFKQSVIDDQLSTTLGAPPLTIDMCDPDLFQAIDSTVEAFKQHNPKT